MTILQKYVLREWLLAFIAVSLVLIVVLFGMFFGEVLRDVSNGRMPATLLGIQLLLRFPDVLGDILPLAAFVAVMWGLGRMYRDQEMAVMRSSGFSWPMMMRPLAWMVFPVAAFLLIVELSLAPRSAQLADNLLEEAFKSSGLLGLQAGRFHVLEDGDLVVYVESVTADGLALENVFIHRRLEEREQVWFAASGRYMSDQASGARFLALENGQVTEGNPGALDYRIMSFARNDIRLPEPQERSTDAPIASRPSSSLLGDSDPESRAELQWRLAPAASTLILCLLAIPLAHQGPREGRGGRIVLGILAYALYVNVLYLCRAWIAEGSLPSWPGMWWVHALVLLVTLAWLQRQGRMGKSDRAGLESS